MINNYNINPSFFLGEKMTEDEIDEMLGEKVVNADGLIKIEDLVKLMFA
jgi:Ca2+-binding EF-hand superfamily protein